jgi:hypothetical protein
VTGTVQFAGKALPIARPAHRFNDLEPLRGLTRLEVLELTLSR